MDPNGKRIAVLDASSFNVLAGGGPDYIAHTFARHIVATLEKHIDSVKNR
jgi:hypothetical protein